VTSAAGTVAKIAPGIAGFASEEKKAAGTFEIFSQKVRPEGKLEAGTLAVPFGIPQGWYQAHFPHYVPGNPAVFSPIFVGSAKLTTATASVALPFCMKMAADFVLAGVQRCRVSSGPPRQAEEGCPSPGGSGSFEVPLLCSTVEVTLRCTPYLVAHRADKFGTADPAYLSPVTTPPPKAGIWRKPRTLNPNPGRLGQGCGNRGSFAVMVAAVLLLEVTQ
jgi:hypothetical protein